MTAAQLAAAQKRRADLIDREFRSTARGIGISAVKFCKELLTSTIYAIPEDVGPSGKKLWRRTGNLRRSEKMEVRSAYEVVVINTAAYAVPRHEAGKPGRRKINPLRVSHWRDELVRVFQPLVADLCRDTITAILRRKV